MIRRLWNLLLDRTCGEPEDFSYESTTSPDSNLVRFHRERWCEVDADLRDVAVIALREWMDPEEAAEVKVLAEGDEGWWVGHHHFFGMAARNAIRRAGWTDEKFPSGNLDDYWVAAVEETVGCVR